VVWLKAPAAPHIEVYHYGNPAMVGAMLKSPYLKLAAQDIAVLESNPAARQRCVGHLSGQNAQDFLSPTESEFASQFDSRYTELVVQTIVAATTACSSGTLHDTGVLSHDLCEGPRQHNMTRTACGRCTCTTASTSSG
jgi:hypothetical protein